MSKIKPGDLIDVYVTSEDLSGRLLCTRNNIGAKRKLNCDEDGLWCEGRVLLVRDDGKIMIKNRNLSVPDRYYDINDLSLIHYPPYSKVKDWRSSLKKHSIIEYRLKVSPSQWSLGQIVDDGEDVEGNSDNVLTLELRNGVVVKLCKDSDIIAPLNYNIPVQFWASCSDYTYVAEGAELIPNQNAQTDLKCPISLNFYVNPVVLHCCGVSICESCFILMNRKCPLRCNNNNNVLYTKNIALNNFLSNLHVICHKCSHTCPRDELLNHYQTGQCCNSA